MSPSEKTFILPKFVVAGPGLDTPYGQRIQKQVSDDVVLKNNVVFSGMLSGDAKWGAFYNCEAFILPSHQENFGIAVVEALACGKPVLITNKVNIWKEIHDAQAGLISDDTIQGTSELLIKWDAIPIEERMEIGKNAKNLFENNFTSGTVSKRFLNAIF